MRGSVTEGVVTPRSGGDFSPNSLQSDRGSVYACQLNSGGP